MREGNEKKQPIREEGMDRRSFMKSSAVAVAAGTILPNLVACGDDNGGSGTPTFDDGGLETPFSPEAPTEDPVMFPMGVASGAARDTSVTLWGLTDDGTASKRLRVWRAASAPGSVVLVVDTDVPSQEGYLKTRIENLIPGTDYHYAFYDVAADGSFALRSAIGRVRTAWAPGSLEPVTFGASTCTSMRNAPFRSLQEMAKEEIDFFVHVGDMSYNDPAYDNNIGASYDVYKSAFRSIWRRTLETDGYLKIRQHCGQYVTWDDHEITDNWHQEMLEETGMRAGYDAYFETLPNERFENDRLWTSYRWGNAVEVFVLDCRGERLMSTRETDYPVYIGAEQMAWFKEGLRDSPCHFKVVLNSVPMAKMPEPLWVMQEDRWDGYDVQRTEILDWIDEHDISNVWFISGDFHVGFIAQIAPERTGPAGRVRDIAVGPGGNGPNPLAALATRQPRVYEDTVFPADQFQFWTPGPAHNVMTTLRFDPLTNSVHARFVHTPSEGEDEVLFDGVLSDDDFS